MVTYRPGHLAITAVRTRLPSSHDSLLPRRWTIINPQVRFNTWGVDQASQSIAWFIPSDDTRQRDLGPEACGDHGNGCCTTETVFLPVHTNDNTRLFGIQLAGVADQVAVENQVASDGNVRTFAGFKREV